MSKSFTILAFLVMLSYSVSSQVWPKVFTDPLYNSYGLKVTETYDHGIVLLSELFTGTGGNYPCRMIKTDINGNELWRRDYSGDGCISWWSDLIATSDSGFLLASNYCHDTSSDNRKAVYIKLNACGQTEWCKSIQFSKADRYWSRVIEVDGGFVGMLSGDYSSGNNPYFTLIKIDYQGAVLWMSDFDNPEINSETYAYTIGLNDGRLMVTGAGHLDSVSWISSRPFRFFVNADGQMEDFIFLHPDQDTILGGDTRAVQLSDNRIVSVGYSIIQTEPEFFESFSSLRIGHPGDVNPDVHLYQGGNLSSWFNGISLVSGSVLALSGFTLESPTLFWKHWVCLADTAGTMLQQREILSHYEGAQLTIASTHDQKVIVTGSCGAENPWGIPPSQTILLKLNSFLMDDSLSQYPGPYDFACGDAVVPYDTISTDNCELVTAAKQPVDISAISVLHVYPNPVTDLLVAALPEFIDSRSGSGGFSIYNRNYNYKGNSLLQVVDIHGRLIEEQRLASGQQTAVFNAAAWDRGLYLVRLIYRGTTAASVKVLR